MGTEAGDILDSTPAPQAAPTATPQATPEAQAPTKPADDQKLASRLEILMRREQGLLSKERQIKDLEEQIKEKLSLVDRFDKAKGGNAKEALDLLGLTYDQLSQAILKDGELPPEVGFKKLEDKISQLESERQQDKQREEENKKQLQLQAEGKAIEGFKSEINTYIEDNKARYELIKFEGLEELVFDVIEEHYKRTTDPETGIGKVMEIKEAADKVEGHLEQKFSKAKEVGKINALWGAIPKTAQDTLAKQLQAKSQPPKTLSNNMSPAPSVKMPRPNEEARIRGIVSEFRAKHGL